MGADGFKRCVKERRRPAVQLSAEGGDVTGRLDVHHRDTPILQTFLYSTPTYETLF